MKQPRNYFFASLGAALVAGLMAIPTESAGQATPDEQRAFAALVAEIAQQQAQIAENQKQIDEKLAIIAENLRVARIYVSRGGGKTK